MKKHSPKLTFIKVLVLAVSFAVTILLIRSIQEKGFGDLFGAGSSINEEKKLHWCEAPIAYLRINREGEAIAKIEPSEEESHELCALNIMGYQPSDVAETSFAPILLVRFEDGSQQVVESDGGEHYRLQGMIFRSAQLDRWISEH